ncbi:MerR family transcriptional regulator, partial [Actinomadura sp. HBU206391]|uniref:MerR family transcriptional regulator n=1 Tax=Actinomadura sp. HBU206391 TaxID=2731692 RepID=UPI001650470A
MESTWTITELAAAAAAALGGEPAQVNGRVRDMPNERLIRWYTTIGLVDPPSARRGRIALYGQRHLLQLVAVKRRQAAGRTIAQIQMELTGATDDTLQSIARVPGTSAPPSPDPDPGAGPGPAGGLQRRFWTPPPAAPRDLAVAPGPAKRTTARSRTDMGETTPSPLPRAAPALVHGVRLAPGVTL